MFLCTIATLLLSFSASLVGNDFLVNSENLLTLSESNATGIYANAAKRAVELWNGGEIDDGVLALRIFSVLTKKTQQFDAEALACLKNISQLEQACRKDVFLTNYEPDYAEQVFAQFERQIEILERDIKNNIAKLKKRAALMETRVPLEHQYLAAKAISEFHYKKKTEKFLDAHSLRWEARNVKRVFDKIIAEKTMDNLDTISVEQWRTMIYWLKDASVDKMALSHAKYLAQQNSFQALRDAGEITRALLRWSKIEGCASFAIELLNRVKQFEGISGYRVSHLLPFYYTEEFLLQQKIHSQYLLKLMAADLYVELIANVTSIRSDALNLAQMFKKDFSYSSARFATTDLLCELVLAGYQKALPLAYNFAVKLYNNTNYDMSSAQLFAELIRQDYHVPMAYIYTLIERNKGQDSEERLRLLSALTAKHYETYYQLATDYFAESSFGGYHISGGFDFIATTILMGADLVAAEYNPVYKKAILAVEKTVSSVKYVSSDTIVATKVLTKNLMEKHLINKTQYNYFMQRLDHPDDKNPSNTEPAHEISDEPIPSSASRAYASWPFSMAQKAISLMKISAQAVIDPAGFLTFLTSTDEIKPTEQNYFDYFSHPGTAIDVPFRNDFPLLISSVPAQQQIAF